MRRMHGSMPCSKARVLPPLWGKVAHSLRHRLAHGLGARKVDQALDGVLGKEQIKRCTIARVSLYKFDVGVGQLVEALQHGDVAVSQAVHDQHRVPCVAQFQHHV